MPRWLAALAVATAVAAGSPGAAGAAPPDAGLFVPGRSLGGITIGASRADVVAAWGAAFGRCRGCSRETLYFNRYAFRPDGAAGWRTAQGLRVDEPLLRLEATYRPLRRVRCAGYDAYLLPGSGSRSVVYVLDERVWGFALLAERHPVCL